MTMADFVLRIGRLGGAAAIVLAMAAVPADAVARPKKDANILSKYEKTGETVSCVSLMSVRDTDIIDDYAMLVDMGRDMYLNEMTGRCSGLSREGRYVHEAPHGRMCRGDIIRVLDSFGGYRGSCVLGAFEKLTEIPEDPEE